MSASKATLRGRWKDNDFVSATSIPKDTVPKQSDVQGIDLRGVPKLGLHDPLPWFKLHSVEAIDVDLSHGDGALIVQASVINNLRCHDFRFDRASYFIKTAFLASDFSNSRLRVNATDCEFTECTFDASTFAGGHNEYGFRRCIFRMCTFRDATWQRTFLRACRFIGCDFANMTISDTIIAGFKYEECTGFGDETFVQCEVAGVEGVT